jgi:DNA mismatch endonuclease (patch repair protein)
MTDVFTKEKRSWVMSRIRSKWTKQEKLIHNKLKGLKIKHKMHPNIEGNPDIILIDRKVAVFLHGCFWHKCPKCYKEPQTNKNFWEPKIKKNMERDKRSVRILKKMGYKVITIWEHEIEKNFDGCVARIKKVS